MTNMEESDGGPVFHFRGDTTKAQFFRVQKALLHSWNTPYTFLPVFFYLFVVMGNDWRSLLVFSEQTVSNLIYFVFISVFYVGLIWYARKSAWNKSVKFNGTVYGKLDSVGIEWSTSHTTTRFKWDELKRKKVLPGLILVFYSPRCAFYFPREFFSSDEQWTGLESFLASKIATT